MWQLSEIAVFFCNFVDCLERTRFGRKKADKCERTATGFRSSIVSSVLWETEKGINGTWGLNLLRKKDHLCSH